ncbi:3-deoxy-7-phosphoheptulonate synthase [Treponema sp. OMZ 792]|nr:3-deoxy-7-phosphoheptulonate synthase [Treponema sp. OMZ 792]
MIKDLVDLRIERIHCISSPAEMVEKIPASDKLYSFIAEARKTISDIISGKDKRFLLIVGPCSIHDTRAAEDYAMRLLELKKKCADSFYIIMRTYFEKPRTVLGWRGLIVEPELDGFINIEGGIQKSRKFLIKLAEIGIPAASEMVDPMIPQYIADLVSWASIGARSAESQIHREIASGLSMPVGFKNTTYGDVTAAVNGVTVSRLPHAFVGIARNGLSAIIHTTGNSDTHLVLRGGILKPNYNREEVEKAASLMKEKELEPSIVIDCSHGNSGKDPKKQIGILEESLKLRFDKYEPLGYIRGCMIESFIQEGKTSIEKAREGSEYGKSITDPCLGWEETQEEILRIHQKYRKCFTGENYIKDNKEAKMNIEIYTDGACSKNPGPGGWAYIIINKDSKEEIFRASGGEKLTTNNRMELMAVIRALQKIQEEDLSAQSGKIADYESISVHTDSQYVQLGISSWIFNWKKNNWKTAFKQPVKNQDLWQELDTLSLSIKPEWVWVRGHVGNPLNEACDRLAVEACKKEG